jgi:hypothetical protein
MNANTADDEKPPAQQHAQGRFGALREKLRHQLALDLPPWQRRALATTLIVDASVAIGLAIGDLMLVATATLAPLLAAILLAIGIANLWSLHSLIRNGARIDRDEPRESGSTSTTPSWHTHATVAQALIAFLALYVWETARQNPQPYICVTAIAAVLGVVAIGWVARLVASARLQWTKTATTIVSIIPLAGLVQFGLQSDFIPRITAPLVDVSITLSPIGSTSSIGNTGPRIHVSANAVIRNRGTQRVNLAGALMRVTAFPQHLGPVGDVPSGIDLSGITDNVFDIDPVPPAEGHLLYAENISRFPGSWLEPGETETVQRVIDIPPDVRLVRSAVDVIVFGSREIRDVKTCDTYNSCQGLQKCHTHISWNDPSFGDDVEKAYPDGKPRVLCADYELEARNIIEEIVGPPPVLRVFEVLQGMDNQRELPGIDFVMATEQQLNDPKYYPNQDQMQRITYANPASEFSESAEYAPTDKDNPPTDKDNPQR